jgi:hypothetical protein
MSDEEPEPDIGDDEEEDFDDEDDEEVQGSDDDDDGEAYNPLFMLLYLLYHAFSLPNVDADS